MNIKVMLNNVIPSFFSFFCLTFADTFQNNMDMNRFKVIFTIWLFAIAFALVSNPYVAFCVIVTMLFVSIFAYGHIEKTASKSELRFINELKSLI